ncbi:hypothetical protein F4775DRAFT_603314 [Biscogniauxia sp. FL1348]|nr:hypothetical protein F4775DRAFT_603314 [Biscogniauxia sp. FL1348]
MAIPRVSNQLLFFCLITAARAYTIFETTCAKPTTSVNFVSSPDSRGTLDILWSSLFTIVACTWTVQHPNLPEQRSGDLKSHLKSIYESVKRMLITVLAPEMIVTAACRDLISAKESYHYSQKFADDAVEWTLTHCFYANMGGFVIRSRDIEGLTYHNPYHLTAKEIYVLRTRGILQTLPSITKEEIDDKCKSDSLVKAIAVIQILWTTLQIAVRAARKLAISQLELAVLAFAVCAVIIYALYWEKPKSICATTVIKEYQGVIPPDELRLLQNHPGARDGFIKGFFPVILYFEQPLPGSPISIDVPVNVKNAYLASCLGCLSATLFGGIHIGAWNFTFPSRAELILWKCASVFSGAYPLFFSFLCFVFQHIESLELHVIEDGWGPKIKEVVDTLFGLILSVGSCLYVIARLFIIVELFRTLCFLPPEAFVSTWTSNIPHIA